MLLIETVAQDEEKIVQETIEWCTNFCVVLLTCEDQT